jgi:membrane protein implicated in regulation of membrane protease activity
MTTGIIGIAILVALVVLFLVWRTVKVFVKLALVGFVALLVVAALVWWNYSGAGGSTPNSNRPAANTRRTTTTTTNR